MNLSPVQLAVLTLFQHGHIVGLTPHAHQAPAQPALPHPQPAALPVHVAPVAALPASNPVHHPAKRGRPLGSKNKPKMTTQTVTTTTTQVQRAPAPIVEGDLDFSFDDAPAPVAPVAPVLRATVAAPKAAPAPVAPVKVKAAPAKVNVPAPQAPAGGFDSTDILADLDALSASVQASAPALLPMPAADDLDFDL